MLKIVNVYKKKTLYILLYGSKINFFSRTLAFFCMTWGGGKIISDLNNYLVVFNVLSVFL